MNKKIPVTLEHAKLRKLAQRLARMHMADKQILWLATALNRIGSGNDANIEFGVKRRKGQDDKKFNQHMKNQMAIRWIAGRMNPLKGDPPKSTTEAIHEAATLFNLEPENLSRVCPTDEELKKLVFFYWDSQRPKIK